MHIRKKKNALSVIEAVDNLSLLAELEPVFEKERVEPEEFIEEIPEERIRKQSWSNPNNFAFNIQQVKETFNILFNYLKTLYENDEHELRVAGVQKAIQAMMMLSMEAGLNLDRFLDHFPESKSIEKVTEWHEYKELQQFYLNVIAPKLQNKLDQVEKWQEEWGISTEEESLTKRQGIKDIEAIRYDKDYELFLIRKDDGRPFFDRALLRHMHLVEQFDALMVNSLEEDPLSRIKDLKDRHAHLCAKEILSIAAPYIDDFYRMGMKYKELEIISTMNKVLIALMLSANPRNLLQTALGKSCANYFMDFHLYFRALVSSKEYQKCVKDSLPTSERLMHCLINLSHTLGTCFFMHTTSQEDFKNLIHLLIDRGADGDEIESPTHSPLFEWNVLLDEDEQIRNTLKYSPYGSLRNAISVFKKNEQLKGFDPLLQDNFPYYLYSVSNDEMNIGCLHLPCPTFQETIKKAEIVPEFHTFLRALSSGKRNQRHLIFNLQDRTSWQEYARCIALEGLQKSSELDRAFKVVTLATGTDFYLQSGSYFHLDDAKLFLQQCKDQIEGGEECGFYFPEELKKEELRSFCQKALKIIHEIFFSSKKVMLHKNRLDFIEIFYLFLILHCMEQLNPDTISFSSKDSIDSGAALSAELFAFLKIMNDKKNWSVEEKDFLRCLFYTPALKIRERAIDCQNFKRAISALCIITAELEAHPKNVIASSSSLFDSPFFKDLILTWKK